MKKLFAFFLLLFLSVLPVRAETRAQYIQRVYNSVVLLYSQTESGGMNMHCTATAYRTLEEVDQAKKISPVRHGYRFASASHCVEGDTDDEQKAQKYFITVDSTGPKTFIPATLVMAGNKNIGDDFSIFDVETDIKVDVIPLGDSSKAFIGESVIDVAGPLGLGKQFFQGYISETLIDRPPIDAGDVKWRNVMLVAIGGGGGSSGSAIVSDEQKAIIGFLVGHESSNIGFLCLPVSKFIEFENAVNKGTYKKIEKTANKGGGFFWI